MVPTPPWHTQDFSSGPECGSAGYLCIRWVLQSSVFWTGPWDGGQPSLPWGWSLQSSLPSSAASRAICLHRHRQTVTEVWRKIQSSLMWPSWRWLSTDFHHANHGKSCRIAWMWPLFPLPYPENRSNDLNCNPLCCDPLWDWDGIHLNSPGLEMHSKGSWPCSYKRVNDKEEDRVITTRNNSLHIEQVKAKANES